jgi:hypothetical protein
VSGYHWALNGDKMASIRSRLHKPKSESPPEPASGELAAEPALQLDLDIAPTDPLLATLHHSNSALDLSRLNLDSPALAQLRAAGVAVIAPLLSQGDLIGVISLGGRRSEQEYTSDDRKLLDDLTSQAAPAAHVRHLPVCPVGPGQRPAALCQRRPRPALPPQRRGGS